MVQGFNGSMVQGFNGSTVQCSGLGDVKIERFEEIEGWQLARELTRKVYLLTMKPDFARDYGLRDGNKIAYATGTGFVFIFKAYKQAHSELCNCLCNAEDGQKDKSVSHAMKFTFL